LCSCTFNDSTYSFDIRDFPPSAAQTPSAGCSFNTGSGGFSSLFLSGWLSGGLRSLRWIVANLPEPKAPDDINLFFVLDLEIIEGKGMLEPLQIEVNIQTYPELIHAEVQIV